MCFDEPMDVTLSQSMFFVALYTKSSQLNASHDSLGHIISDLGLSGVLGLSTSDLCVQATQPGVISSKPVSKKHSSMACS